MKPKKILYVDVETTGLDPVRQDIIQLAGIIIIDGKEVDEFDLRMQPFSFENISNEALEVNDIDKETLLTYRKPQEVYQDFCSIIGRHVDKYDKKDKFYPAGYNVKFDIDFIAQWFIKNHDKYFGSWQNWRCIDPLPFFYYLDYIGKINLPNYKLETVCKHFEIEIKAHDALSDIRATRELMNLITTKLFTIKE